MAGDAVTGSASARQTYACGLWASVPPPASGEHELVVDGRGEGFRTTVRYRLVVAAAPDWALLSSEPACVGRREAGATPRQPGGVIRRGVRAPLLIAVPPKTFD
ncbi:hypothetical protein ACFYOT_30405 [Saccharothrix saharensis]|uniref:hypothetical protein n=1 Tax=Saccharothrix saharensis TaxID=571190 RepID=UPI0036829367